MTEETNSGYDAAGSKLLWSSVSSRAIVSDMADAFAEILAGSNDDDALYEIYTHIKGSRNPAQALFVEAWELSNFIASDGFEFLFEQERSIDEFARLFAEIGFHQVLPILDQVKALVPQDLVAKEDDAEPRVCLTHNFDKLKKLLYEYFDIANDHLMSAFGDFVRSHKDEFAE